MKILIVDDKYDNLYLLETILKGNKYIVISAVNGAQALELARKENPELIISDILMPVMDGFNLCRELKKDKSLCNIPLIFYTATYTDPKDEEFAMSLGADRYLLKPQDPDELLSIIEDVLETAKTRKAEIINKLPKQEVMILKEYNETLIRKLEDKMIQTELSEKELTETNIILRKEISERQRTEEELLISETRYRRLFESAKDGILIINSGTGKIIDVNPFLVEMLKYSYDDLVGKEVWEISPFKDIVANKEKFMELHEKGYVRYEALPLETAEGEKKDVEFVSNVYAVDHHKYIQCNIRDISERVHSENALKESEKKFRQFIETAIEGVCVVDANDDVTFVNRRMAEMVGYEQEYIIGKNFMQFVFQEDYGFYKEKLEKRRISGGEIYERRLKRIDGSEIWVIVSASPIFNISGKYDGSFGMFTDITERKLAEKELRESEERLRSITQSANDAIITVDIKRKIIDWNLGAKKIFGYSRDETVGKKLDIIIPTSYFERYLESITSYNEERDSGIIGKTVEVYGRHKNGGELPVELSIAKWETASGVYFTGIMRDISARKRYEKDIQMLAHAVESVAECVSITDSEDNIIFINDAFIKTYGYSKEELLGKHISIVRPKEGKAFEKFKDILPGTIQGGWKGEIVNRKKDGSEFPVHLSTSVIRDEKGAPIALIGVATDITELLKSRQELIQAKEKAEESDRLKTEFLAQMSHEIRTPINVIIGNVSFLDDSVGESVDNFVRESFKSIELASKRIVRTIDLILNAAELKTGAFHPNYEFFDVVSKVVNPLFTEYLSSANEKGLEFSLLCQAKETLIYADVYSVTQILANLLDNAIKYTQKGKVELFIGKNDIGRIFVEVRDTGIGMSKKYLENIFKPFTQEEQGYSRTYEGNGLGLTIVKKYCELNYSYVEVKSEKNKGSVFKVIFNR